MELVAGVKQESVKEGECYMRHGCTFWIHLVKPYWVYMCKQDSKGKRGLIKVTRRTWNKLMVDAKPV